MYLLLDLLGLLDRENGIFGFGSPEFRDSNPSCVVGKRLGKKPFVEVTREMLRGCCLEVSYYSGSGAFKSPRHSDEVTNIVALHHDSEDSWDGQTNLS